MYKINLIKYCVYLFVYFLLLFPLQCSCVFLCFFEAVKYRRVWASECSFFAFDSLLVHIFFFAKHSKEMDDFFSRFFSQRVSFASYISYIIIDEFTQQYFVSIHTTATHTDNRWLNRNKQYINEKSKFIWKHVNRAKDNQSFRFLVLFWFFCCGWKWFEFFFVFTIADIQEIRRGSIKSINVASSVRGTSIQKE